MEIDPKSNSVNQTTTATVVDTGIFPLQVGVGASIPPPQVGAGITPPQVGASIPLPQVGAGILPRPIGVGVIPPHIPSPEVLSNKRSMGGHYSQKKKWRSDQMDLEDSREQVQKSPRAKPKESFNLKTLNTSATYKKDIESYLKAYFNMVSNLIEKASTKVTDFYYEGSMLTISKLEESGPQFYEIKGDGEIYKFLNLVIDRKNFTRSFRFFYSFCLI